MLFKCVHLNGVFSHGSRPAEVFPHRCSSCKAFSPCESSDVLSHDLSVCICWERQISSLRCVLSCGRSFHSRCLLFYHKWVSWAWAARHSFNSTVFRKGWQQMFSSLCILERLQRMVTVGQLVVVSCIPCARRLLWLDLGHLELNNHHALQVLQLELGCLAPHWPHW